MSDKRAPEAPARLGSVWCLFWRGDGDSHRSLGSVHASKADAEAFLALDPASYPNGHVERWAVHPMGADDCEGTR